MGNTRIGQSIAACSTPAVPMATLDQIVLTARADRVLAPERLKALLREMKSRLEAMQASRDDQVRGLQRALAELEQATNRLYQAVETGMLPMTQRLLTRAGLST